MVAVCLISDMAQNELTDIRAANVCVLCSVLFFSYLGVDGGGGWVI